MSTGAILLLVLTVLFTSLMAAILFSIAGEVAHGDAAFGQGIAWLYVFTLATFAWLSMAGLLRKASGQGLLPERTGMAAAALWVVSAIAAVIAFNIMVDGTNRWAAVIPVSIPFLVALYVIALSARPLRPIASRMPVAIAVGGLIGLLCCVSLFGLVYKMGAPYREAAAWKAEMEDPVKKAERREKSLEKLQTMTGETPLEQWMPLLRPENGVRSEALAKLRTSPRRQDDIERVALNSPEYLELIPEMDVQLTFPLCDAMDRRIWDIGFAISLKTERGQPLRPDAAEPELTLLPWYKQHGCVCGNNLAYLAQKVQECKDSPARRALLDRLAQLMR